jgi:hypothetical protein
MRVAPLHRLAEMISKGERVEDQDLLETLGRDGTITVQLKGGHERLLPSGEILEVLSDGAGIPVNQVLARSFSMNPEEIEAASMFIRLVQFAGENQPPPDGEQPFQALDR